MEMTMNAAKAAERRRARRTMEQLEEMSKYDWGYCIGMEGLMRHFGKLIAEQVRLHLTIGNRGHRVLPPVLEVIARYAEWHSVEHGEGNRLLRSNGAGRQAASRQVGRQKTGRGCHRSALCQTTTDPSQKLVLDGLQRFFIQGFDRATGNLDDPLALPVGKEP